MSKVLRLFLQITVTESVVERVKDYVMIGVRQPGRTASGDHSRDFGTVRTETIQYSTGVNGQDTDSFLLSSFFTFPGKTMGCVRCIERTTSSVE